MTPEAPVAGRPARARLAPATVWKVDAEQVLMSEVAELADGRFACTGSLAWLHPFFGPDRSRYDVLLLAEAVQQAGVRVARSFFEVPEEAQLILTSVSATAGDLAVAGPGELTVDLSFTELRRRRVSGQLLLGAVDAECRADGRTLGRCRMEVTTLPQRLYRGMRARARARIPTQDAWSRGLERAAAGDVGRSRAADVVVGRVEPAGPGRFVAPVLSDPGHPVLFDQPHDHVPGMLMVEAVKQISAAAAATLGPGTSPREWRTVEVDAGLTSFAELDAPLRCEVTLEGGGGVCDAVGRLEQAGSAIGSIRLRLAAGRAAADATTASADR